MTTADSEISLQPPFRWPVESSQRFLSASQQAAVLRLQYCVQSESGCALLAGQAGCGKTSVLKILAETPGFTPFVHVTFPQLAPAELLAMIATELSSDGESFSAATHHIDTLILSIRKSLVLHAAEHRHPVVAIDDAHLISDAQVFETIQSLLNLRDCLPNLRLSIIFTGQPALLARLMQFESLGDRISIVATMTGFTPDETIQFVQQELLRAGVDAGSFSASALLKIHQLSLGLPRRICRLGELSTLLLQANDNSRLEGDHIAEVAQVLLPRAA